MKGVNILISIKLGFNNLLVKSQDKIFEIVSFFLTLDLVVLYKPWGQCPHPPPPFLYNGLVDANL